MALTDSRTRHMPGVQEYPDQTVVSSDQIGRDRPESVQALRRGIAGAGGCGCVSSFPIQGRTRSQGLFGI
ncbi:hypothetical protein H0178_30300 [Cytobacillus firmus]|nr:hypothetical protein [Cytobacillus firmus]